MTLPAGTYRLVFPPLTAVLALLIVESALRLAYPLYADYDTEMWRYSAELKRRTGDPDRPFEHRPRAAGRFYGVEIRTDGAGRRADRDAATAKPAGTKRVVVLGDSIALGWGVAWEDTFARRLEVLAAGRGPVEVLNTGVGNYNTVCELGAFRRALAFAPDVVVLQTYINDAETARVPAPWLDRALRHSYLYGALWGKVTRLRHRRGNASPYRDYYLSLYAENAPGAEAARRALAELRRLAAERGLPLLVLHVPEMHGFRDYPFADITARFAAAAGPHAAPPGGAAFVDMTADFAAHEPRSLWVSEEDPHPNATAHGIIAEKVYGELVRRGWL